MKNRFLFTLLLFSSTFLFGQEEVAHYPLDGNGIDIGDNAFTAIVYGTTPTEDRFGNQEGAMLFNGEDNYLRIPNQTELNFGAGNFAISIWVKTSSEEIQMLTHNGDSGATPQYWLRIKEYNTASDSDIKFLTSNGIPPGQYVSMFDPSLFNDEWHHIVVQRRGLWLDIYFDAILVATNETTEIKVIENTHDIFVGAQPPHPSNGIPNIHNFFNGAMDDLIFFKDSLSQDEITNLFNDIPTETSEIDFNNNNISLFPNPTSGKIDVIGLQGNNNKTTIMDNTGRVISSFLLKDQSIDLSKLASGMYFVRFENGEKVVTRKLIKD